jgi:hypothetical protein
MKFKPENPNGFGSSTPLVNEDFNKIAASNLRYQTFFHAYIRRKLDTDKNHKLDTTWYHFVFLNGVEIYQFRSYKDFEITEIDNDATKNDLVDVVKLTHRLLIKNFESRIAEYEIFNPIDQISDDAILNTVDQLQEVLLEQLKQ